MSDFERGAALRECVEGFLREHDSDLDEGVLTGLVVVAEWVQPDGVNTISRHYVQASGDQLPSWRRDGLLHHALFARDWDEDDEDGS